jgi:hypothetical protein
MTVLTPFDPTKESWSFSNWKDATYSWDLYRRTYLAINPTQNAIEAPSDSLFYETIYKSAGKNGNCFGMSMLGLALHKFGGFMGYCAPASFYTGDTVNDPHTGPDRADLHAAINVMHGRQFSAAGVRDFLDRVKQHQLNNGYAAFERIVSGLGSGDYALISLSNGVFGTDGHVLIPYKAEDQGSTKILHLWDPVRPYVRYPEFYDHGHNQLVITGPASWHYDQKYTDGTISVTDGHTFDGSNLGWCFAIPLSIDLHKGRQPFSVGFVGTEITFLFASGAGAAVTQIEDDDGRRLFVRDRVHSRYAEFETSPPTALEGVARWPWLNAAEGGRGASLGDLYVIERPQGNSPLTVTVRGSTYGLVQAGAGHLLEIEAAGAAIARDRIRIEAFGGADQAVELRTGSALRTVSVRQLRPENDLGHWRAAAVRNVRVERGGVRIGTSDRLGRLEIAAETKRHAFHVELQRYRGDRLASRDLGRHVIEPGESLAFRPRSWDAIEKTPVDRVRRAAPSPKRPDRKRSAS